MAIKKYINREISWLAFNHRVLQESKAPSVPLFEKIKFAAIFSSNLDEFFRVRVASLRSLLELKKKSREELKFNPAKLLKKIHKIVGEHQEEYGRIIREIILPGLEENDIYLVDETELSEEQKEFVGDYFRDEIRQYLQPVLMVKGKFAPFLRNKNLYLAVRLVQKGRSDCDYALIEIPTERFPRFFRLPDSGGKSYVMFLDDVVKAGLSFLFPGYDVAEAYSVKLTRDAELYIDDEFSGDLLKKIKQGLKKRNLGPPCRFLYDKRMPENFLGYIRDTLNLTEEDLVPGGRRHNYNDLFSFPNPVRAELENIKLPPLRLPRLDSHEDIFSAVSAGDILLHFPYQTYDYVIDFFEKAANDPDVTSIKATQYRVATNSAIVAALIKAAKAGKDVMVFVEVKARFDEESNIYWAEEMEKAGVKVFYSFPGLKVHAKIALVTRNENGAGKQYAYFSTGNFNESNAKIYTDLGFLTTDTRLTDELSAVFDILAGRKLEFEFKHLLVAQYGMARCFLDMIRKEMNISEQGGEGKITLKLNAIEDRKMIKAMYKASQAGVGINVLCRGICCLKPGVEGLSENIRVWSIVDRFLEHSRIFLFRNGGNELLFAGSADWMKRNLRRRIEVIFPIYDEALKKELKEILAIQFSDNCKARIVDPDLKNEYRENTEGRKIRSQHEIYNYLKSKIEPKQEK